MIFINILFDRIDEYRSKLFRFSTLFAYHNNKNELKINNLK